ncbi:uncharacterized protein G2W53_025127 [Senna tora]|uniref:Uncharacterized protein n=1 Tax=Senna tora TaxID=362788 RepID=A0A834TCM7_9FABA|nr:uncharacterized protein G2W53_025127 [Senna tora]
MRKLEKKWSLMCKLTIAKVDAKIE